MAVMVLGSAFGPLPFGAAFDYFGGYREILYLSLLLPVIASILSFGSPPPVVKTRIESDYSTQQVDGSI